MVRTLSFPSVLLGFFLGVVCIYGALQWHASFVGIRPIVQTGYVQSDAVASKVFFWEDGAAAAEGLIVAGVPALHNDGVWREEPCIQPLAQKQLIQLAVLNTAPVGDGIGRKVVVWVKCLSE
jgi:hypothetical protein